MKVGESLKSKGKLEQSRVLRSRASESGLPEPREVVRSTALVAGIRTDSSVSLPGSVRGWLYQIL